jgi:hippurate hydrolase
MKRQLLALTSATLLLAAIAQADELKESVKQDYDVHLGELWDHFHRNPELSTIEHKTAARMAKELRDAGFEVTEGVGGTGVVAILKNGEGPMAMMRADMDGLPLEENSGLPNASRAQQRHPETGEMMPVMHACGHDVHITSLVGTARQMAARKDQWNGTLMLIVQPAEEIGLGARSMREDNIWDRFGEPDFAFAFHVATGNPAGRIKVSEGPKYAGSAAVDIIVHGVPGHGASPHHAKDPVLIGSQIIVALQTLVSRELAPRASGVVSVGSFNAGDARNIIPDQAVLKLSVRFLDDASRELLLNGVERIAVNVGRAAGLPEDKLPEVIVLDKTNPPTYNDPGLTRRLKVAWVDSLGEQAVFVQPATGMGAEDYPHLVIGTDIKSVYWSIGGTPQDFLDAAKTGGPRAPGHHSPLFWIAPEQSVRGGVEATVVALLEVMGN